jgi:hypothetical protein
MDKNSQPNLEELIHRELLKLPVRSAPATLIPRILARIEAQSRRRWWQRPWTQWPISLQVAAVPLMLAMVTSALWALWALSALSNRAMPAAELSAMPSNFGPAGAVWDVASALGTAVVVVGRSANQQWLWLSLFVPIAMYLACIGLGTLAYRMALHSR